MAGDGALRVDVLLLGGGIAGLWALTRLRQAGYSALLVEPEAVGGLQSICSQGIIHGGAKYAFGGVLSESARAIGDMPEVWRDCLAGAGEIDLSPVRVLADAQLMWTTAGVGSRVAGFFAGKLMQSRMEGLERADYPALFADPTYRGRLYRLREPVLDTASLAARLAGLNGDALLHGRPRLQPEDPRCVWITLADGRELAVEADALLLCAGAGNEGLLGQLGRETPRMQRRPLHMGMLRGPLPPLHAHCLGASPSPRLTVTSYPLPDGDQCWYLGGDLSESGVARSESEQIAFAQRELAELLPWVDFSGCRWATLRIDRAELATPDGRRPEQPAVASGDGLITVWPTKLAFAPRAARQVLAALDAAGVRPRRQQPAGDWPQPPLSRLPWQRVDWRQDAAA